MSYRRYLPDYDRIAAGRELQHARLLNAEARLDKINETNMTDLAQLEACGRNVAKYASDCESARKAARVKCKGLGHEMLALCGQGKWKKLEEVAAINNKQAAIYDLHDQVKAGLEFLILAQWQQGKYAELEETCLLAEDYAATFNGAGLLKLAAKALAAARSETPCEELYTPSLPPCCKIKAMVNSHDLRSQRIPLR